MSIKYSHSNENKRGGLLSLSSFFHQNALVDKLKANRQSTDTIYIKGKMSTESCASFDLNKRVATFVFRMFGIQRKNTA